jgi:hypothetical protein
MVWSDNRSHQAEHRTGKKSCSKTIEGTLFVHHHDKKLIINATLQAILRDTLANSTRTNRAQLTHRTGGTHVCRCPRSWRPTLVCPSHELLRHTPVPQHRSRRNHTARRTAHSQPGHKPGNTHMGPRQCPHRGSHLQLVPRTRPDCRHN